jgi:hypothetical protein
MYSVSPSKVADEISLGSSSAKIILPDALPLSAVGVCGISSIVGRLSVDDLWVKELAEGERVASRVVLREVRRDCDLRLEEERDLSPESLMFPSDRFPALFEWVTT